MIWICGVCLVASGDLGTKELLGILDARSDAHPQYKRRKPKMSKSIKAIIPIERIEASIYVIRGQRVMLDVDLADLYGVSTGTLNRAVKRNLARFPADFMFRLSSKEFQDLRFQFGISRSWGGRRYLPYVFTQEGVAMLSGVLHSKRAIAVNIEIMRTFVRLRQVLATNATLAKRLDDLERRSIDHGDKIEAIFDAIRALMAEPEDDSKRPAIGYQTERTKRAR
jgi:hypothetical protein